MPHQDDTYQIIWLIRRLFRSLAQRADESLRDLDISAADRAVMEFLYPGKQQSVPAIAAQYQVSRQHVQVTTNRLVEAGFLATTANPRHKRSPLIGLTGNGRKLFETIKTRESNIIDALFSGISGSDLEITRNTLKTLLDELNRGDT